MAPFFGLQQALKQARIDLAKPDRYYGTEKNLNASRKKSAIKTKQTWLVKKVLKKLP